MSSDNFDLESDDGRIWQNLSASAYEDLSPEAIVAVMEMQRMMPTNEYSDYTEYGVTVAGQVTPEAILEAKVFLLEQRVYVLERQTGIGRRRK